MKTIWKLSLIALAVIGVVVTIAILGHPKVDAPINQTRSDISEIYVEVATAEHSEKKSIVDILDGPLFQMGDYNAKLAAFLENRGVSFPHRSQDGKLRLVDQWGHDLLVYPKVEAVKLGFPDNLTEEGQNIIIWSVGPNGQNEFGKGDDIVVIGRINWKY